VLPCPACRAPLSRAVRDRGDYWGCNACGGRAVREGALRRALPGTLAERILAARAAGGRRGLRRCPFCDMHMVPFRVDCRGAPLALDGCDHCRLLWFDGREFEAAGGRGAVPPPTEVDSLRPSAVSIVPPRSAPDLLEVSGSMLDATLGAVPEILGLPVASGEAPLGRPWATHLLAAAVVAVSLLGFVLGTDETVAEWGLLPARPFRHGGMEFLASFFFHASPWHLLANVWFLLMFGEMVEDLWGPGRTLLLLGASALCGDLLFLLFEQGSRVPSVGASGGIAGVLACYALLFPRARIRVFRIAYFQPITFHLPAMAAFGFWLLLEIGGALLQSAGMHGVNHLAHLGGAAAGVALWYLWRE